MMKFVIILVVARGPALINNRGVSKGLKRESPSRGRGLIEGKGYDEVRHHTGWLLLVSFAAY